MMIDLKVVSTGPGPADWRVEVDGLDVSPTVERVQLDIRATDWPRAIITYTVGRLELEGPADDVSI